MYHINLLRVLGHPIHMYAAYDIKCGTNRGTNVRYADELVPLVCLE